MKIKKKEIMHYKGKVYDIKVSAPDRKYNINDIVVHNSAGGSLILFVLDITKIDPVRHNLIFERFTNPARKDPPDVDLDLDSDIHKTTESYLIQKYGADKVCHIGNFLKFGAKTAVKDLSRIYQLDYGLTNKLTQMFTNSMTTTVTEELQQAIETAKKIDDKELVKFIEESYKYFAYGDKIVGMIRQSGRHASGILISDNKLNRSDIPILKAKGELVTAVQEGMEDREVSELGYMKLDILGLNTAGIVNNTFKLVESKYGLKNLEQMLLKSKFDDAEVWRQFAIGNSQDIFQFGGEGMIKLIKEIAPNNIYELTAINSLYRPANIEAEMDREYIHNRMDTAKAKEKVNNIFPGLYELLEETYGAIVYQEQIMFVMEKVGGFSLAESDKARKILKKLYKKGSEAERNPEFDKLINKFKEGAIKKGVTEDKAEALLQTLSKYTGYTFNKSHSLAYSINAYISMWLKVHYPLEYFATLFNHSSLDDMTSIFKLASEQGIKCNDFVANEVGEKFSVDYEKKTIKMGLRSVKGLPEKDIDKLLGVRLHTLDDLIRFTKEEKLGKKAIELLCRLQYFKNIHQNSKALEDLLMKVKTSKAKVLEPDSLFPETGSVKEMDVLDDYTTSEKLKFELDYLGYYIHEHPFSIVKNIANHLMEISPQDRLFTPSEAYSKSTGNFWLYGIVTEKKLKKTKTGKDYYNIVIEDDVKQLQLKIWEPKEVVHLKTGNGLLLQVESSKFGFSKKRNGFISVDMVSLYEEKILKKVK